MKNIKKTLNLIVALICGFLLIYICKIRPLPYNMECNLFRIVLLFLVFYFISRYFIFNKIKTRTITMESTNFAKIGYLENAYSDIIDTVDICQNIFMQNLHILESSALVKNLDNQYIIKYDENLKKLKDYDIDIYHKAVCLSVALLESVESFFIYTPNSSEDCIYTSNYNKSFALFVAMQMCGIYDFKSTTKNSILPYCDYISCQKDIAFRKNSSNKDSGKFLHDYALQLKKTCDLIQSYNSIQK